MAVHEFELFHGIALTKLVRCDRPVTLVMIETAPEQEWAVYTINTEVNLLIKHSARPRALQREGGIVWTFSFSGREVACIRCQINSKQTFAALVCGNQELETNKMAVCLLEPAELSKLLDLTASNPQAVTVKAFAGKQLRVSSSHTDEIVIPRSRLDTWSIPGS